MSREDLANVGATNPSPVTVSEPVDCALMGRLAQVVRVATDAFEAYIRETGARARQLFLDMIPEGEGGPDIGDTFLTRWAAGQAAILSQLGMLLGPPPVEEERRPGARVRQRGDSPGIHLQIRLEDRRRLLELIARASKRPRRWRERSARASTTSR